MTHEMFPGRLLDDTMKRGMISAMVLVHLNKRSTYPYALMKNFKASHHPMLSKVDKSQVYNTLNALERDGFVKSRMTHVGAKQQKMYSITPKGKAVVLSFKRLFFGFVKDARSLIQSEFK